MLSLLLCTAATSCRQQVPPVREAAPNQVAAALASHPLLSAREQLMQIGPPHRRLGPRSQLFRDARGASRIVFVLDAGGSMMQKMADVKNALRGAIQTMRPPQSFDIVMLRSKKTDVFTRECGVEGPLALATTDNRRLASIFLESATIDMNQASNPFPGLRFAFNAQPDLVYLLTDGDFEDNEATLRLIRALNTGSVAGSRKARINTILLDGDLTDCKEITLTLMKIAQESSGSFLAMNSRDLE